jgi:hypothetical protein
MSATLVTYKIVSDVDGKLKAAARTACNFWNRFIAPKQDIVIRLGVFTSAGNVIARAYRPYTRGAITYGNVEFNTRYLGHYNDAEIAGTVVHEIGHTLGYGWDHWMDLFDHDTGRFTAEAIAQLPKLRTMRVETDHGPGTELAHWDEEGFGAELMTGFKDHGEHVLPVTIDVAGLLGHTVIERLRRKTSLSRLLRDLSEVQFTRKRYAKSLDLDYFKKTKLLEEVFTDRKTETQRA